MVGLQHENIVTCYGYSILPDCIIVMEYLTKGTLYDIISGNTDISPECKKQIALDIVSGLVYLHGQNICHRDIKSTNVLLNKEGRAKLSDFGFSKRVTGNLLTTTSRKKGTTCWMAPELFKENAIYSFESDIYSLGMTLFELTSREIPFKDAKTPSDIPKMIVNGDRPAIPADCPPYFNEIITSCWGQEATNRANAQEVFCYLQTEGKISQFNTTSNTQQDNVFSPAKLLMDAAQENNIEIVRDLISAHGAGIVNEIVHGKTALMWASRRGCIDVLVELLNHGAEVNILDKDSNTALMKGSEKGELEVVEKLIGNGAEVNCRDNLGQTALLWAIINGHESIAAVLLSRGADLKISCNQGKTPLMWASSKGHTEIVASLLNHAADPNITDNVGQTALIKACEAGHTAVVSALLASPTPIDIHIRAKDGVTAMSVAKTVEIQRLLAEKSGSPQSGNKRKSPTPFEVDLA